LIAYTQYTKLDAEYVLERIRFFLEEDIPDGDKTTLGTVSPNKKVTAEIQAVESLVFSGNEVIPHCFDDDSAVHIPVKDGDELMPGDIIGHVIGKAASILSRERVMLNLIQRLCGIATQAKVYAELARPYGVKILDTRKTTPGLRLLEKYAVTCGGGYNHRSNLSDGVLIKDNHLKSVESVRVAVQNIRKLDTNLPIELEVDTFEQIHDGLAAGVDGFLLDNMHPNQIREAIQLIRNFAGGDSIFVEASGGITLDNLHGYLDTGVNAISIGALTHQIRSKDIRLEFV
jgi:nicotinate-nucleotide pyrophosphorylase (carboxylating)|tara:strand:- start:91 stop:951 length:861 start_codon:yes stop_codon:yes gene_type:complete